MVLIDCTIHLIVLNEGVQADEFLNYILSKSSESPPYLLKGGHMDGYISLTSIAKSSF